MYKASRKVIILNKLSSPYVSEAIIILKDNAGIPQTKAVEEAERIVRRYMDSHAVCIPRPVHTHRMGKIAALCIGAAIISCLICFLIWR